MSSQQCKEEKILPSEDVENKSINDFTENAEKRDVYEVQAYENLDQQASNTLTASDGSFNTKSVWLEGSDSCASISPSPGPDGGEVFDFEGGITYNDAKGELSAALQAEKEFLDFMCSLPQVQEQVTDKIPQEPKPSNKTTTEEVSSLDHLGHLCRVVEQLAELKEQNVRLQKRVQYLEDLRQLHQMHQQMKENQTAEITQEKSHLSLDLRHSAGPAGETRDANVLKKTSIESRRGTTAGVNNVEYNDKEKKGHRSAWGKVKHIIINTRKDGKKNSVQHNLTHSKSALCTKAPSSPSNYVPYNEEQRLKGFNYHNDSGPHREASVASSDPEEYDLNYDQMYMYNDLLNWDPNDELESPGIWMGPTKSPKNDDYPNNQPSSFLINDMTTPSSLSPATPSSITSKQLSPDSFNSETYPRTSSSDKHPDQPHPLDTRYLNSLNVKPQVTITGPSVEDLRSKKTVTTENKTQTTDIQDNSRQLTSSNWNKVKHAFLTPTSYNRLTSDGNRSLRNIKMEFQKKHGKLNIGSDEKEDYGVISYGGSLPPSPKKSNTSFNFEEDMSLLVNPPSSANSSPKKLSSSTEGNVSSPNSLLADSPIMNDAIQAGIGTANQLLAAGGRNLADLQKTLSDEFNKKLHEWDKLKSNQQWLYGNSSDTQMGVVTEDNLPEDFKKKLQEWERMKEKEKVVVSPLSSPTSPNVVLVEDHKIRRREENTLPPEFKKRLTEWEIGKVLAGKSCQNIDELQKNLGEEFNKKMAEWERIKNASASNVLPFLPQDCQTSSNDNASSTGGTGNTFERKGSLQKGKRNKNKTERNNYMKYDTTPKIRDKDIYWLERELNKIEREKLRLEKEKERFIDRQTRLEKMWEAYRTGHEINKKDVFIKTSTGEFRFEGINPTFTKKLFEWEERKGIRPESSTIALLAPQLKKSATRVDIEDDANISQNLGCDIIQKMRSKSESSIVDSGNCGPHSNSVSSVYSIANDKLDCEAQANLGSKASSEPNLLSDEPLKLFRRKSTKSVDSYQLKEKEILATSEKLAIVDSFDKPCYKKDRKNSKSSDYGNKNVLKLRRNSSMSRKTTSHSNKVAYAPSEITRLIDSSDSEEEAKRRLNNFDSDLMLSERPSLWPRESVRSSDSIKSKSSYKELLNENINLLEQLKTQEVVCIALQTQMGDIDSKMDSVHDQHIKTLEKLHEEVSKLKESAITASKQSSTEGPQVEEINNVQAISVGDNMITSQLPQDVTNLKESCSMKDNGEDDSISDRSLNKSYEAVDDRESEVLSEANNEYQQSERDIENKKIIEQLKERICELEARSEHLQNDKEKIEASFQLHKEREVDLAQSLFLRMKNLHEVETDIKNTIDVSSSTVQNEEDRENKMTDDTKYSKESMGSFDDLNHERPMLSTDSSGDNLDRNLSSDKRKRAKTMKRQSRVQEDDGGSLPCNRRSLIDQEYEEIFLKKLNDSNVKLSTFPQRCKANESSSELKCDKCSIYFTETLPKTQDAATSTMERHMKSSDKSNKNKHFKCDRDQTEEEKDSAVRHGTIEKRRRIQYEENDESSMDERDLKDRSMRKRRKTPTKKVMKLHNLTADLLFQAKRLEQTLVSKNKLARESMGSMGTPADTKNNHEIHHRLMKHPGGTSPHDHRHHIRQRSLRGQSSLRLSGEITPRFPRHHLPKVPGQTRTWSSIETIAAPSEGALQSENSRVSREGNSVNKEFGDSQQDLLAVNAEISRMAKELRQQMMELWTFRESISPESMTAEMDVKPDLKRDSSIESQSEARRKLFLEAQEVFTNIASLQKSQDSPSPPDTQSNLQAVEHADSFMKKNQDATSSSNIPSSIFESLFNSPKLSQKEHSYIGSMKASTTSPSLQNNLNNFSNYPLRDAKSLDFEDVNRKDDFSHWLLEANSRKSDIRKAESIEEENEAEIASQNNCDFSPEVIKGKLTLFITDSCEDLRQPNQIFGNKCIKISDDSAETNDISTVSDENSLEETPKTLNNKKGRINHNRDRNLPDFDQLLPNRANPTFADLVRVHDQLYEKEMLEQRQKSNEKPRSKSQAPLKLDHLQRAFFSLRGSDANRKSEENLKTSTFNFDIYINDENSSGDLKANSQYEVPSDNILPKSSSKYGSKNSQLGEVRTAQYIEAEEIPPLEGLAPTSSESFTTRHPSTPGVHPFATTLNCLATDKSSLNISIDDNILSSSFEYEEDIAKAPIDVKGIANNLLSGRSYEMINHSNDVKKNEQTRKSKTNLIDLSRKQSDNEYNSQRSLNRKECSKFETEVTVKNNCHPNSTRLRARRVSDSQVEYQDHTSESKSLPRKLSSDIFVQTKRTIFTPVSNCYAAPTFLNSPTEETSTKKIEHSHNINADDIKFDESQRNESSNIDNSKSLSKILVPKISYDLLDKEFSSLPRQFTNSSCFNESNLISTVVDSKKKILQAANEKTSGECSPTVRGLIKEYNKRICERQSMLSSPFKQWGLETFTGIDSKYSHDATNTSSHSPSSTDMYMSLASVSSYDNSSIDYSVKSSELPANVNSEAITMKKAKEDFPNQNSLGKTDCNNLLVNCKATCAVNEMESIDSPSASLSPSPQPNFSQPFSASTSAINGADGELRGDAEGNRSVKRHARHASAGSIIKSASTVLNDIKQLHPIRQCSTDSSINTTKRYPHRIFKLFKRSKDKDKDDLSSIQKLCRCSLAIDIGQASKLANEAVAREATENIPSSSKNTLSSNHKESPGSAKKDDVNESVNTDKLPPDGRRCNSPTRSCPSSPVSTEQRRPSRWFIKGKELFKGRSHSPSPGPGSRNHGKKI